MNPKMVLQRRMPKNLKCMSQKVILKPSKVETKDQNQMHLQNYKTKSRVLGAEIGSIRSIRLVGTKKFDIVLPLSITNNIKTIVF